MQHNTSSFESNGETLFYQQWQGDEPVRAQVLIAHGYGEHSGRYQPIASALAARGYAVAAMDHRGHGRSSGTRFHFDRFGDAVDDWGRFFDMHKDAHPQSSIFILGHSMGSLIVSTFALQRGHEFEGLIISGSTIDSDKVVNPLVIAAGRIAARIVPRLRLVSVSTMSEICSDPDSVQAFMDDPLTDKKPWRVGIANEMLTASQALRDAAHQIKTPLLILHGQNDPITPASGAEYLYKTATSEDKTLHIYPDETHEPLNGVAKETAWQDVFDWLDAHSQ